MASTIVWKLCQTAFLFALRHIFCVKIKDMVVRPHETHSVERINWHSLPLGDVFALLASHQSGLRQTEAQKRMCHFGRNVLKPEEFPPGWKIFLRQFLNPLIFVLLAAGAVTWYMRLYLDAAIIFTAVVIGALGGFVRARSAEKTLSALKKLEIKRAVVWRDGQPQEILSEEVVPGDVMLLKPGNKVPADGRLIKSYNLQTGESILTGESAAVNKKVEVLSLNTALAGRANSVFGGTTVLDGTGEAVVWATGLSCEIGRAGRVLANAPKTKTPLERKTAKLGRLISAAVILLAAMLVLVGLAVGRDPAEILLAAVAVAVAAVPQNLPVAISIILAVGLRRILKFKGLVRSLAAAETLGRTSVVLTDKTGTLTQGRMRVSKIVTPERRRGVLELSAQGVLLGRHRAVLSYGLLAAEVIIENPQDEFHNLKIHGRPVDKALAAAGIQAGLDYEKINQRFKKITGVAFSSERKFSASLRQSDQDRWLIVVGSPDVLLPRVKKVQILDRYENITQREREDIKEAVDGLAGGGLKVLAFCSRRLAEDSASRPLGNSGKLGLALDNLNFVGLAGLEDPVREDIKDFIRLSRQAGIHTVMVTGDHSLTARSLAKEVGLLAGGRRLAEVAEGKDIEGLEVKDLSQRVRGIDIFSRVTPEHKLKIVEAWQAQGEVVAVVGDGVNDGPALKRADIGAARGDGVDLAKEASEVILLENGFSTLVRAVREGRVILYNVKKVVAYLLSTGLSEIVLVGLSLFLGLPLPFIVAQILWVNLVQAGLPAAALALEPAEKDVMASLPTSLKKPLLDGFMRFLIAAIGLATAAVLFVVFYFFRAYADSLEHARSVTFVALGVAALGYSFSIRSWRKPLWTIPFFENKYLLMSVLGGVILLAAAVYVPALRLILRTQPVGLLEWIIVFGFGVLNVTAIELAKWYFVHRRTH